MFVHGPGGIGKTTLLDAMARRTRARRPAGDLPGCPRCRVLARGRARGRRGSGTVDDPAAVLLVDGYELLAPLDRLVPDRVPPGPPRRRASRSSPAARRPRQPGGWTRAGVGWSACTDSTSWTTPTAAICCSGRGDRPGRAGWPSSAAVIRWPWPCWPRWTGPVADRISSSDAPDAVGRLCALILDDVPDEAHRTGLATCAHATRTTQDLLTRMIGSRAPEVWAWLESRPYVRQGPSACSCTTSYGSCSRPSWRTARRPSRSSCTGRSAATSWTGWPTPVEPHPDRAAAEVLLLHRKTPLAAETSVLRDRGQLSVPRAGPAEREEIVGSDRGERGTGVGGPGAAVVGGPAAQRLPRSSRHRDGGVRAPGVSARTGRPDGRRPGRGGRLAAGVERGRCVPVSGSTSTGSPAPPPATRATRCSCWSTGCPASSSGPRSRPPGPSSSSVDGAHYGAVLRLSRVEPDAGRARWATRRSPCSAGIGDGSRPRPSSR